MQTAHHKNYNLLLCSIVASLKLTVLLSIFIFIIFLVVIALNRLGAMEYSLPDHLTFQRIAIFYCGSFVGVFFTHYLLRKEVTREKRRLDTDLNKISEEVKLLEDKINQINI